MEIPCKSLLSFFCYAFFCSLPAILIAQVAEQTSFEIDFGNGTAEGYQKVNADNSFINVRGQEFNFKPTGN
jgi:hypothetical protein